jgi:hypothetical protein
MVSMAESGPSFIPRRTPNAPKKQRSSRSIGLFGYVSYILFFGSVLLSGGMLVVAQQVQTTLAEKQSELSDIRNQFNQSDMNRVQEYEQFLTDINSVFARSISLNQIFTAIEDSVVQSAVLTDLSLKRTSDELNLVAAVQANSFDTALFQRSVYQEFPVLQSFTLEDVVLVSVGDSDSSDEESEESAEVQSDAELASGDDVIDFSLSFDLASSSLPFDPQVVPASDEELDDETSGNTSAT